MAYFRSKVPLRPRLDEVEAFLSFHGYKDQREADIDGALRAFQLQNGLPATGRLNWPTCRTIRTPRCSNPELSLPTAVMSQRWDHSIFKGPLLERTSTLADTELYTGAEAPGYETIRCRWARREVTYCFVGGPPPSLGAAAFATVRAAFAAWSAASVLRLTERSAPDAADIRVLWTFGPSQDPSSPDEFYGPGDKVASGYYPYPHLGALAGDLHFDAAERWTLSTGSGTELFRVALHEIGHCLGLGHCFGQSSVMAPNYQDAASKLEDGDRAALALKYTGVPELA